MAEEMKKELNQGATQTDELDDKNSEQVNGGKGGKIIVCYVPGCNFSTRSNAEYLKHMWDVHRLKG